MIWCICDPRHDFIICLCFYEMILFHQVIHHSSLNFFSSRCFSAVLSELCPTSHLFHILIWNSYGATFVNPPPPPFQPPPLHFCVARFPLPILGVLVPPEKEREKREKEKEEKLQGRRESHGETLLRDLKGIFTQPWDMGSPTEGNRQSLKKDLG